MDRDGRMQIAQLVGKYHMTAYLARLCEPGLFEARISLRGLTCGRRVMRAQRRRDTHRERTLGRSLDRDALTACHKRRDESGNGVLCHRHCLVEGAALREAARQRRDRDDIEAVFVALNMDGVGQMSLHAASVAY